MKQNYIDIIKRISDLIIWWDLYGCPRYNQPTIPKHLMGYIKCQQCEQKFWVALVDEIYKQEQHYLSKIMDAKLHRNVVEDTESNTYTDEHGHKRIKDLDLYEDYKHLSLSEHWHYGDPPYHWFEDASCIGNTMNSIAEWEWADFDMDDE